MDFAVGLAELAAFETVFFQTLCGLHGKEILITLKISNYRIKNKYHQSTFDGGSHGLNQ